MQSRVNALERSQREPIAIIGMGCRFPGNCRDADSYWHLLRDGIDAIGPIPESRWDVDAFYDADPNAPGKMYTRHGGFLSEIDAFEDVYKRQVENRLSAGNTRNLSIPRRKSSPGSFGTPGS